MPYSATQLQLTHVLQRLFRDMGATTTLASANGTMTTAIDTKLAEQLGEGNVDDFPNGGTIIIIEDAGGAAAAPEGEFSRITDYVASSNTFTFSPALTVATGTGDRFLFFGDEFPLYDIIEVVNDALRNIGDIPLPDTSVTTAANQTEYTLPLALKGQRLLNVEIQGILTDANDNRYVPVPNWKIIPAAAGSTGLLVLPQYPTGYTIRLTYLGKHPRVSTYAAYISEYLHPDLVQAAVFAHVMIWKNKQNRIQGAVDNSLVEQEQISRQEFDRALVRYPVSVEPIRLQPFPAWNVGVADEFKPIPLP